MKKKIFDYKIVFKIYALNKDKMKLGEKG